MNVPLFDMASELAAIRPEVDGAIARVLDSGIFIGGPEVSAFEQELATFTHARHAVAVSSGTDALLATLMALGIGPGDEVVTPPFTFFATIGAPLRLGAKVVFADVDADTLTLDPHAALAACTPRTRAIIPVNLFGYPAVLPASAPCPIVEDAAQSVGTHPPRGVAATLSFFPTKNLGALGDGGAILTDDASLADRLTLLRSHGARPKYHHVALGGNFRLDPLQAAVLRAKLAHLERWTHERRAHAAHYIELFTAGHLPPEVRLPALHDDHVFHHFVLRVPRRDALRAHLAAHTIGTEVYYPEPLHRQPIFTAPGHFPNAERACTEVLAIPMYPTLTATAQARVVDAIAAFYA